MLAYPLELLERDVDDRESAVLEAAILRVTRGSKLSDEDLYRLLARFLTGRQPLVDWPPQPGALARRCATALASREPCQTAARSNAPTTQSLRIARAAIVAELRLTPRELLAVLADHWHVLANVELPGDLAGCSLLAFAEHLLLEPLVAVCGLIWSVCDPPPALNASEQTEWAEWPRPRDTTQADVIRAEVTHLRPLNCRVPDDIGETAAMLAHARADELNRPGGTARVSASIVRTSGWPGDPQLISRLADQAVGLALHHARDITPETDNEEIINTIQDLLVPGDEALRSWAHDPSFGTLSAPAGTGRTGAETLQDAADWLTRSLARAAVQVASAMRQPPQHHRAGNGNGSSIWVQ